MKLLHLFDHERDNVVTIQALLLMSHYYPSSMEHKHTWYWLHQAISLAQCTGFHRKPKCAHRRRLWARIWWACLVRDRMISMGTGRPLHINSLDCDLPMLSMADLEEPGDSTAQHDAKLIFIELVRLCQCIESVMCVWSAVRGDRTAPEPGDVEICREGLHMWVSNLNEAAKQKHVRPGLKAEDEIVTMSRSVLNLVHKYVCCIDWCG